MADEEYKKVLMELSAGIADRVRDILDQRGLSVEEFAGIVGESVTVVRRWLSGTCNLSVATIAKMTAALGQDIVVLHSAEEEDQ